MSARPLLDGRVAIVTGGARGIGLAISEALHRQGASVLIADSGVSIGGDDPDPSVAESVAARLGDRAVAFTADVAAAGAAQAAVQLAAARFGAVDIVINNAAILRDALIFKATRDDWERVIGANLSAAFALLAAATPLMREQQKNGRAPGRIVNIVSSAGLFGNFGQAAYASAKAGLFGLTRVVAMDMARSKVGCNAIAPFAATRVTGSIQPVNEAQARYKARALRIPVQPVARFATFLASNAHELTGQLFGVRGRELLLFSQPRPVARAELTADAPGNLDAGVFDAGTFDEMAKTVGAQFSGKLADLSTDLEFFDSEPLI